MPPKRMKVAAITNSGNAIRVGEFNSLMTSCAAPTSGWPEVANMTPAQSPSARNTGMPVVRSPANSVTKPAMPPAHWICGSSWLPACCGSNARQAEETTSPTSRMT